MTQLTEEQRATMRQQIAEAVKEIRQRQEVSISFFNDRLVRLLNDCASLLDSDSQAAGCADFERYWDEYQYPHLPNGVAGYEHAKRAWNAAATSMRDKCVEKVKERLRILQQQTLEMSGIQRAACQGRDAAIEEIVAALASLTVISQPVREVCNDK